MTVKKKANWISSVLLPKHEEEQQVQPYKTLAYRNTYMPCSEFWLQFITVLPDSTELAKLHLSTPATSVPSESAVNS